MEYFSEASFESGAVEPRFSSFMNQARFEPDSALGFKKRAPFKQLEYYLYKSSLISLAALCAVDCFSTLEALKYDGLREANPIMRPLTKNKALFISAKLGLIAFNHLYLEKLHKKKKTLAWAISIIANGAMSYVVAHNFRMIQNVKRR
ncbi:DUF5658 family protein [Acidobacteriota bacterium]